MKHPILTIVIANFNYGRFLEQAIESIVTSLHGIEDHRLIIDDSLIELIVCDGGSTDNSVDVIRRHEKEIFWWCSEKDGGQSAAFNKGFARGTGKYLTWLNADDIYLPGALKEVIKALKRHPDCDWFTGNALDFTQDGSIISCAVGPHWYPDFLQRANSPIVVPGPTSFFSRKIYENAGGIDESLHYNMDTFLWINFMLSGVKQRRINSLVWAFRRHAASKTAEFGDHKMAVEKILQAKREFRLAMSRKGLEYHCSSFVYALCLIFRMLDLSLLRRWLYRRFPSLNTIPKQYI